MRIILTALFVTIATHVAAEGRLPDVFWIECNGKTLIGSEKDILVKIDRVKKIWEQKLPTVNNYQICADNEDVIRYKTSPEKDCSDYADFYLNKWSGNVVGMGQYKCEILDAEPKPKWSNNPVAAPPLPTVVAEDLQKDLEPTTLHKKFLQNYDQKILIYQNTLTRMNRPQIWKTS